MIVPGKPDESLLYQKVRSGSMPAGKPHLSDKELATLKSWIEGMAVSTAKVSDTVDTAPVTQNDVVPIMLVRCTVCHGGRRQEGGLDLRTRAAMLKGGKSGPAIVLGKPEDSLVIKRIQAGEMPPKQKLIVVGVKPVTPGETQKIAKWIAQGAPEVSSAPTLQAPRKIRWCAKRTVCSGPFKRRADRNRPRFNTRIACGMPSMHFSWPNWKQSNVVLPRGGSVDADSASLLRFDRHAPGAFEVKAFLADKDPEHTKS